MAVVSASVPNSRWRKFFCWWLVEGRIWKYNKTSLRIMLLILFLYQWVFVLCSFQSLVHCYPSCVRYEFLPMEWIKVKPNIGCLLLWILCHYDPAIFVGRTDFRSNVLSASLSFVDIPQSCMAGLEMDLVSSFWETHILFSMLYV